MNRGNCETSMSANISSPTVIKIVKHRAFNNSALCLAEHLHIIVHAIIAIHMKSHLLGRCTCV